MGELPNLSDWLRSINDTKEDLFDTEEYDEQTLSKSYPIWTINRCLSYFPDTIRAVHTVNSMKSLTARQHFDLLRSLVRKRKRFSKWVKPTFPKEIESIKKHYQCSLHKALEYHRLLDANELETIVAMHDPGGEEGRKRTKK